MAVIAGIVLGFFAMNYSKFQEERSEEKFLRSSEEIAASIRSLKTQGSGAQTPVEIVVPDGCTLKFEGEKVRASNNGAHTFETGTDVSGGTLGPGSYDLILQKTDEGIQVKES